MAELRGKRSIMKHMKMGWRTIMYLYLVQDFPMAQIGRVWVSDTVAIKSWRWRRLNRRND